MIDNESKVEKCLRFIKLCTIRADDQIRYLRTEIEEICDFIRDIESEIERIKGKKVPEKFIQKVIKKPGALRKTLGVKKGAKIPAVKLAKAEHSKNPITKKRAVLAKTLKNLH